MAGSAAGVVDPQVPDDRLQWDYPYRSGLGLRPAPDRATDPSWTSLRKSLYGDWLDIGDGWQHTAQTLLLDDHRWQGDEVMDDVVRMFDRVGAAHGRDLFERVLTTGPGGIADLPWELNRLWEQINRLPEWYDHDRIERGRRILNGVTAPAKLGAAIFGVFATATSHDVSAATGATGRIVRDPVRRAVESHEFFEKVTYRGGLERGSDVFNMIVRVRLMHSLVRRGLRRQWGDDDFCVHGMPISNTRLVEGSAWFGSMPMLVEHRLGRRRPMRDHDDVALFWAYILYVFGAEERLIPLNGYDSITLANHLFCDAGEASKWRTELIEALLKPVQNLVPFGGRYAVRFGLGAGAAIMGDDTIRKALDGTDYESTRLVHYKRLYLAWARPLAVAAAVVDGVPVLRQHRWQRTGPGDPLLIRMGRMLRAYGARHGVTDIPFIHHDNSTSGESFGRPMAAAQGPRDWLGAPDFPDREED